ncbi:MAG: ABC transporter ATP-binding protein, partial [Deltaproteobacteria bacterium]|nr:ABC transporter ATP-binding protein [Deltaproteobacteria bacterium]
MRSDFGYFEEKQLGKPYDLKLLARLYPYTQPYKLLLAASIVLVVFITLLDLSLPYVTKIAIDRYIVPKIESTGGQGQGPVEGSIRYLKADLADPGIRAVVEKHPRLFKIHGDWATIPYDDLTKLSKKDLGTLRKNDLAGVAW